MATTVLFSILFCPFPYSRTQAKVGSDQGKGWGKGKTHAVSKSRLKEKSQQLFSCFRQLYTKLIPLFIQGYELIPSNWIVQCCSPNILTLTISGLLSYLKRILEIPFLLWWFPEEGEYFAPSLAGILPPLCSWPFCVQWFMEQREGKKRMPSTTQTPDTNFSWPFL